MSEKAYGVQGACNTCCNICLTKGWEEVHSLADYLKHGFSTLSGVHPVSSFSLPKPYFWDSEWFPAPGHQLHKFICVYLFSGFTRKTSPQNSNITSQMKQNNKLEALDFDIKKMRFEKEGLCRILDLYKYNNLNYR